MTEYYANPTSQIQNKRRRHDPDYHRQVWSRGKRMDKISQQPMPLIPQYRDKDSRSGKRDLSFT